ncbi:MAG: 30S ribosomal protein S6 [Anaerolineae bacterium]
MKAPRVMRDYELIVVIQPNLEEEGVNGLVEKIGQVITAHGGQVTETNLWGKRKLAYPIRKAHEGYYVVMQTQMERKGIGELERNLKLTEEVLRYLLVRVG